jgi:tetratricopeptide (TPR) repeat protein
MKKPDERFCAGEAWAKESNFPAAIREFRLGLLDQWENGQAWDMLGRIHLQLNDLFYALDCFKHAERYGVHKTEELFINICGVYRLLGMLPQSEDYADRALALNRNHMHAHLGKASVLVSTNRRTEAADYFLNAIKLCEMEQIRNEIRGLLGLAYLGAGKMREGWEQMRPTWGNPVVNKYRRQKLTEWDGKSSVPILLVCDQGFGDILQFLRYAERLRDFTNKPVYAEVQPQIARLVKKIPGIDQVFTIGDDVPVPAEHFFSIMMLPDFFSCWSEDQIYWPGPYLGAKGLRSRIWKSQLDAHPLGKRKLIGICWAAGARIPSQGQQDAEVKSVPFEELFSLSALQNVAFVILQVGQYASAVLRAPPIMPIIDFHADIQDFYDTAALIEHLDAVVSPCTAVAHCAGAMGKPTFLLLSNRGDWRWFENRNTTKWYPTMRILQQPSWGDWPSVITDLREILTTF